MNDTSAAGLDLEDAGRVTLGPLCTLRESLALKAQLVDRLALDRDIELDGGGVERIDSAGLQLLAAFAREVGARHHAVHWTAVSTVLRNAARQLGLDAALCLTAHGATAR